MNPTGLPGRGRIALLGLIALCSLLAATLAPADAGAAKRPNVLLVNTDDQRARDTLQIMPRTTRWLRGRGTLFERSYATTPVCCPSRVSLLTGTYAHNHGIYQNRDPRQIKEGRTIQRYMSDAGYRTGVIGKLVNNYPFEKNPRFWDSFLTTTGGYFDTAWNLNGRIRQVKQYSTTFISKRSARFIEQSERRDRKPWFLYVAPSAPHGPLVPEPRFANTPVGPFRHNPATKEKDLSDKPPYLRRMVAELDFPEDSGATVREAQLRMLISVDRMMGKLRRTLGRNGELRKTIVIFTSDNGLLWGEHGRMIIKDLPYRESIEVPLLISAPGILEPGGVDRRLVANIDLAPTILDAAGVELPRKRAMDGRSIFERGGREALLLEYGGLKIPRTDLSIPPWVSIIDSSGAQLIESPMPGGRPPFLEYYDNSDPWQIENPLGNLNPLDDPDTGRLQRLLDRYRDCRGASCP